MTDFVKVELRIPLFPHQTRVVKEEFPRMNDMDQKEYVGMLIRTDNVLIDKIEPLLEQEVIPTFCGDINVHDAHIIENLGMSGLVRCPGI